MVLYDAALKHDAGSRLVGEHVSKAIAVHLVTTYAVGQSALPCLSGGISRSRLGRVLERMDKHAPKSVPVSELAKAAGLSEFHFSRAFRQSTGASPHQYLLERRIERTKSLLGDSDKSVVDIAASVGFAQQSHFARVFRTYRVSPNEFRQRF